MFLCSYVSRWLFCFFYFSWDEFVQNFLSSVHNSIPPPGKLPSLRPPGHMNEGIFCALKPHSALPALIFHSPFQNSPYYPALMLLNPLLYKQVILNLTLSIEPGGNCIYNITYLSFFVSVPQHMLYEGKTIIPLEWIRWSPWQNIMVLILSPKFCISQINSFYKHTWNNFYLLSWIAINFPASSLFLCHYGEYLASEPHTAPLLLFQSQLH